MAMGLADAVPGVSGGTVALILGIYQTLIDALARLLGGLRRIGRAEGRRAVAGALRFLLPLGLGAVSALYAAISLLIGDKPAIHGRDPAAVRAALADAEGLLINPATAPVVFAAFFGLVAASVPEPWRHKTRHRPGDYLVAGIAALVAAGLAIAPAAAVGPHPVLLVASGAVAIGVMLLPGISGSLALLVLGMYQPVAGAVHDRDLGVLAWFLGGMAAGLLIVVPALQALLRHAHDRSMSVLCGLMAGSLVALWPWKPHFLPEAIDTLGPMHPIAPHGAWWWCLLAGAGGVALIVVGRRVGHQGRAG